MRGYLVEAGFRVVSQNPDIAAGDNFLARMHEFLRSARDLVIILTADYDDSDYTVLEFTSFMAEALRNSGSRRLLIFRCAEVEPRGLLAPFRYVDLIALPDAARRREAVVAAANDSSPLDFTTARRVVQSALRYEALQQSAEASEIEALVGGAARARLDALDIRAGGISTDFGPSIREFLALYAGAGGAADVFGGRDEELAELTAWLHGNTASPYRLIVGSAGRGKSMLLVRWALEIVSMASLDVIFIPVSIRCQTNTASAVLQSLVSRLARVCDDETPALVGVRPEVLCDMAVGYLQKPRGNDRRMLVILDGLDEAVDKEIFRGLLPTNPPPSLRVVLSARPQVGLGGDDDDWRAQLGFGSLQSPARRALLHIQSLDRLDAVAVTAMVAHTLAGTLDSDVIPQAAEELFRLSEGEPFILTLYLTRLVETGPHRGDAVLERLMRLEPGLRACFRDWWMQQTALWKNSNVDEETIVAVLGVLSSAHGPMSADDIQAVVGKPLFGYAINTALAHLQRFVIATAGGERVTVFHERLADFVKTTLMTSADLEALRRRFVNWGLSAAAAEGQVVPTYVIRHLGSHLHRYGLDLDRIAVLLRKRWADAWLELEGNHSGFLGDVNRVLTRAVGEYARATDAEQRSNAFLLAIDAVLVRASAISVAESLPSPLLPLLITDRIWTSEQALAYVRTIHKDDKKLSALRAIAEVIDPAFHRELIDVAWSVHDGRSAAAGLSMIGSRIGTADVPAYLDAAARFHHPVLRADILRNFRPPTERDRHETLALIAESRRAATQNHELARLALAEAAHVSAEDRTSILMTALQHVRAITPEEGWISGLGAMLKAELLCELTELFDAPDLCVTLAREALQTLQASAEGSFARITFSAHADVFAKWLFPEAFAFAASLVDTTLQHRSALLALVGELDPTRWPELAGEALAIVDTTIESVGTSPSHRFHFDTLPLTRHFLGERLDAFGEAIERITEPEYRWKAWVTRLRSMTGAAQHSFASELFDRVGETTKESWSAEVMTDIARFLPDDRRAEAIRNALVTSRTIHDEYSCHSALIALAGGCEGSTSPFSDLTMRILFMWPLDFAPLLRSLRLTERHFLAIMAAIANLDESQRPKGLISVAASVTAEAELAAYRACVATIAREEDRHAAVFALLGIKPLEPRIIDGLAAWLHGRSYEERDATWPPALNEAQTAFLADHRRAIRDPEMRVAVGARIDSEVRSRGEWAEHFSTLKELLLQRVAEESPHRTWDWTWTRGCTSGELLELAAMAEGRIDAWSHQRMLLTALEIADSVTARDAAADRLLAHARTILASDPDSWVGRNADDVLITISHSDVSDRVVHEVREICSTLLDEWKQMRVLQQLVPRMNDTEIGQYVDVARVVWPPATRIELVAAAFPRLSHASRTELFDEATEWMTNYFCGGEPTIEYLRMSELAEAHALRSISTAMRQLESSARIGGSVTPVRQSLQLIDAWSRSGRLRLSDTYGIVGMLLEQITAHQRDDVANLLAGMVDAMPTLIGVAIPDVMNRMSVVLHEWP